MFHVDPMPSISDIVSCELDVYSSSDIVSRELDVYSISDIVSPEPGATLYF